MERTSFRLGPKSCALITATLVRACGRSSDENPFRPDEVAGGCQDFLSQRAVVVEGPARNGKRTSEPATSRSLKLGARTGMRMKFCLCSLPFVRYPCSV